MEQTTINQPQILIVTGYSGAGKSTVLRALEDIGFFCVDNLPIALLDSFYQLIAQSKVNGHRVALGVDVRGGSIDAIVNEIKKCKAVLGKQVNIFFLTSSSRVLLRRFQETRRKHPLAEDSTLSDAIEREQLLMKPLSEMADLVLDTDQLNIHQLRSFVRDSFAQGTIQKVLVNLVSFGFKYGVPEESNFVYDVRSLPNPYFIPSLKILKGTDQEIIDYLFDHKEVTEYWEKLIDFVRYSIDRAYEEGRFFMRISIGCTGGRHRSVAFVQLLAQQLADKAHIVIEHRDIGNDSYITTDNPSPLKSL
jgi:UPF0042 nucleotide-binding protein